MTTEKMTGNIRIVRSSQMRQFDNQVSGDKLRALHDKRLSWGALGMWMRICDLPEDAEFSLEQLQAESSKDNLEDVADYYYELIDLGYIEE